MKVDKSPPRLSEWLLKRFVPASALEEVQGDLLELFHYWINKDFLKPIALSLAIAGPVAFYFMNRWLEQFAYRIALEWWMFALAGVVACGIVFLTTGYQSIKASLTNPVKSLRSE